ncbi:MAG TPA: hypothetical protein VK281_08230 [Xanthobacteraceae bacterium]|nr:hypothetical protein [Xanthobacteraceae bacterium]
MTEIERYTERASRGKPSRFAIGKLPDQSRTQVANRFGISQF